MLYRQLAWVRKFQVKTRENNNSIPVLWYYGTMVLWYRYYTVFLWPLKVIRIRNRPSVCTKLESHKPFFKSFINALFRFRFF